MNLQRRFCRPVKLYKCVGICCLVLAYYFVSRWLQKKAFDPENGQDGDETEEPSSIDLRRLVEVLHNADSSLCSLTLTKPLGGRLAYAFCKQSRLTKPKQSSDLQVISAENHDFELEKQLSEEYPNANITVFGSGGPPDLTDRIRHVKFLFYFLSGLPYVGRYLWCYYFLQLACNSRQTAYSALKLGGFDDEGIKPWILLSLIDHRCLEFYHQVHLYIDTRNGNGELVHQWLDAIKKLQKLGFQLFHSRAIRTCDSATNTLEPCCFTASWIKEKKTDIWHSGINPLDPNIDLESHIQTLLTQPTTTCNKRISIRSSSSIPDDTKPFASFRATEWPICSESLQNSCIVYSAKIGGSKLFELSMARLGCGVYLFDPTLPANQSKEAETLEKRIHVNNWGLGNVNANIVSGVTHSMWKYVKAGDVVKKLGHEKQTIDVLRLDLHGGEWDVLHEFVESKTIMNCRQIIVTMHVWYGEEVYNLIDRFMRLQKLHNSGFQVYYSEPLVDATYGTKQSCCYLVGWIKRP